MRKNFTQLFLGLALLAGFATMGYSQCDIDPPAGAYYNFQFDGGMEGWRSLDAAGFETTLGWTWSETGDISMGNFGPAEGTTIASESQCNGAMVMDSDFLDNDGMDDNFGNGPCPAPCTGYLVSPVMDLTDANEPLEIMFFQAVRQFNSEFNIYISIDGGASNSDTIPFNELLILNDNMTQGITRIPFCDDVIEGQSQVVITFEYISNYYFWAIDDFSIVPSSLVDLRVNKNFYAKTPNYATPKNMGTTVPMLVDVENRKVYDSPESTVNFRVLDGDENTLFSSSRDYESVPACGIDQNQIFDDMFPMPSELGDYSIEYDVLAEGDDNVANDLIAAPFKITDREFRKVPTIEEGDEFGWGTNYLRGVRFGSAFVSWGAYFYIPQNEGGQAIESVSMGIVTNAGETPSAGTITVSVYQWLDLNEDGDATAEERIKLGTVDYLLLPDSPEFIQFTVTPLDPDGQLIVPAADAELLIMAHTKPFDSVTNYFFNCAYIPEPRLLPLAADATNLAHRTAEIKGGKGSFAAGDGASPDDGDDREFFNIDAGDSDGDQYLFDVSMILTPTVGTEDINENINVSVYPSPASNKLNVDLNLEELSKNVSIELLDMTGNKVGSYNFNNIKNNVLSVDVSDYTAGMYLMNIRTEAGMISKKISVIH